MESCPWVTLVLRDFTWPLEAMALGGSVHHGRTKDLDRGMKNLKGRRTPEKTSDEAAGPKPTPFLQLGILKSDKSHVRWIWWGRIEQWKKWGRNHICHVPRQYLPKDGEREATGGMQRWRRRAWNSGGRGGRGKARRRRCSTERAEERGAGDDRRPTNLEGLTWMCRDGRKEEGARGAGPEGIPCDWEEVIPVAGRRLGGGDEEGTTTRFPRFPIVGSRPSNYRVEPRLHALSIPKYSPTASPNAKLSAVWCSFPALGRMFR